MPYLFFFFGGILEKYLLMPKPSSSEQFKGPNICIKALLFLPSLSSDSVVILRHVISRTHKKIPMAGD